VFADLARAAMLHAGDMPAFAPHAPPAHAAPARLVRGARAGNEHT
jgi:hypothetical protein